MSTRIGARQWSIWAAWMLANVAGWAAGITAGELLALAARPLGWINEDRFPAVAILLAVGLATGLAQGRVMRRYLPRSARWLWATLTGYLLCLGILVAGNAAGVGGFGLWGNAIVLGAFGAAIGGAQWRTLRRHHPAAGLWVPASALGFLSFLWLVQFPAHSLSEFLILAASLGVLSAVLPGLVLAGIASRATHMAAA